MTTKIAISLPDEQVAELRAAVRSGRAASVSALVSEALAERSGRESLTDLLAHLDEVHGPIPDEDIVWAQAALRDA
jgi:Arc/MetJ-type ribon-helix-helix transcriptional regulator